MQITTLTTSPNKKPDHKNWYWYNFVWSYSLSTMSKPMLLIFSLVSFSCLTWPTTADGQENRGLKYVETADGDQSKNTRSVIQWTHARLVFKKDLSRIAVGQDETMSVEILNSREALVLAKKIGRTSLIVWYPDGSTETFLFSVVEDLSVLRNALKDIDRNLRIELAPDRAALILRGTVPTVRERMAAEKAAKNYLNAGVNQAPDNNLILKDALSKIGAGNPLSNLTVNTNALLPTTQQPVYSAIINLVKVKILPKTLEEKINDAIKKIGGQDVAIERVVLGDVENDKVDSLVLKGSVKNQIALVRILKVASRLVLGNAASPESLSINVIADESGGLLNQASSSAGLGGGASTAGGIARNEIQANIGRAKMLSTASGRILSLINVVDLPQVRVSVQMHEVSRSRLKSWRPDAALVSGKYRNASFPADLAVQEDASRRVGANESNQIENALQLIGGTLTNHFQVGGSDIAFDMLFSLLENEGISKTLSKPTLTVLTGEQAVFQVGGEVPVPSAFAPVGVPGGDNTAAGVFNGTEFKAFGIQLRVKPMVGEDDRITLDINPSVSTPDTNLTQLIAGSSGSALNSTAFNTRSIDTTTRLRDGQPLVIGGLVSRDISNGASFTPGVHKIPILGKLAESNSKSDTDKELIIVVTPTLVREPLPNTALWHFPLVNLDKVINTHIAHQNPEIESNDHEI